MTNEPPRIVDRKRVYTGWNKVEVVTVEAPDCGATGGDAAPRRHLREAVEHGEAAVVLTIDRERDVALLVRQWRIGLIAVDAPDPYLLEACAGILDPGETPEETARREAREEMGLKVGALRSLGSVLPSAGTLTERMHLFLAEVTQADRVDNGGGVDDEGESIEVVELPMAELFAMARSGRLEDAKTLIIVQRLMIEAQEAGRSLPR